MNGKLGRSVQLVNVFASTGRPVLGHQRIPEMYDVSLGDAYNFI